MYLQLGSLFFAVILGAKRAVELRRFALSQKGFVTGTMLSLAAGAVLIRFISDQNEEHGLGDGISLLICANFAAGALQGIPSNFHQNSSRR